MSTTPTPPLSKLPQANGSWKAENIWKISPSMVGGLMGEMAKTYGITRDNCLAYIWERNQPEYFYECLHNHGYKKTVKQWLEEHFNPSKGRNGLAKQEIMHEIRAAIMASTPRQRWMHIANAKAAAELSLLTRTEKRDFLSNPALAKDIKDILHNEITRQVFTESGTIGEEQDIISFFKDGNFDALIGNKNPNGSNLYDNALLTRAGATFKGKPFYWNDNRGTSTRPVYNVKISHRQNMLPSSTDEYFHNLRWYDVGMVGGKKIWGATAWGKFDGLLFGNIYDSKNQSNDQYYDVFEAKQRQSSGTMVNEHGKADGKMSEKIQMQIYMQMVEQEKLLNKPPWRFERYPLSRNNKTGAWLLQTQWNSRNESGRLNQTLNFIPWDDGLKVRIDNEITKACQDLWAVQIYQHRTQDAVSTGLAIQKRILESVAWKY